MTPKTKIVFIANPNNPTGTYLPFDEMKRLHAGLPPHVLLVIDAAYSEYVSRNDYEVGIELVATNENVVMLRTFSKIHGLAAMRVGWMYAPAHIVDACNRVRGPFNLSTPAMKAAIASLEDPGHIEKARAHNDKWLPWLTEEIGKLGLKVTPSVANFVLIHFKDVARPRREADAFLTKRGLILRRVAGYKLPAALRMTVGTEEANRLVVEALAEFVGAQVNAAPIIFNRLALIGFGLIGGSIARAARAQGLVGEIVATARSAKTRARVAELGIVDRVVETNAEAVKDADLVIVCIPVGACGEVAQEIGPHLKPGAIVSDVGSVKGAIVRDMGRICPTACTSCRRTRSPAPNIPARIPVSPNSSSTAGASSRRPKAPTAARSNGCKRSGPRSAPRSRSWTPDHHDLVLAITSHLPHLIAYTIVGTADELEQVTSSEVMKFSAGGFRDFTRIAASDPTMWRDVFLTNKDAVLEMLGTFNEDLSKLTRAIRRGDGDALFEHFTRTRAIRRGIVQIGQDSAAPDFGRPHEHLGKSRSNAGRRPGPPGRDDGRVFAQYSGGICPTFSGPRNTAPSTKRSGNVRAFLPSSSASLPSALIPAATPTLAFCLTTLPRPGIARSSAPNRLLRSCVLTPGATRSSVACGTPSSSIFSMPSAGITFSMPATVICNSPSRRPLRGEAERAGGDRDQIALRNPRLHDLDMAAGGLHLAKPLRPGFWREILQAAQQRPHVGIERLRQQRMHLLHAAALDLAARFRSRDDRAPSLRQGGRAVRHAWRCASGVCIDPLTRSILGSSNTMEARCGTAGSPTTLERAVLQFTDIEGCPPRSEIVAGRGEFGDQQFRIVDLRHDQDLAEPRGDRRLRRGLAGGLRHQRDAGAVAADFEAERETRHRSPGAIIDPAGLRLLRTPGVGFHVDLGGGIEPERAPRRGGDQEQDGHDEKAPKRAPARREGHIGHAATFGQ